MIRAGTPIRTRCVNVFRPPRLFALKTMGIPDIEQPERYASLLIERVSRW
jgi:hypothetical protein